MPKTRHRLSDHPVNTYLPPDAIEALDVECERLGVSRSGFVRMVVLEAVRRLDDAAVAR